MNFGRAALRRRISGGESSGAPQSSMSRIGGPGIGARYSEAGKARREAAGSNTAGTTGGSTNIIGGGDPQTRPGTTSIGGGMGDPQTRPGTTSIGGGGGDPQFNPGSTQIGGGSGDPQTNTVSSALSAFLAKQKEKI